MGEGDTDHFGEQVIEDAAIVLAGELGGFGGDAGNVRAAVLAHEAEQEVRHAGVLGRGAHRAFETDAAVGLRTREWRRGGAQGSGPEGGTRDGRGSALLRPDGAGVGRAPPRGRGRG